MEGRTEQFPQGGKASIQIEKTFAREAYMILILADITPPLKKFFFYHIILWGIRAPLPLRYYFPFTPSLYAPLCADNGK